MRGSMAADLRAAKVYEEFEPEMFSTQMKGAIYPPEIRARWHTKV